MDVCLLTEDETQGHRSWRQAPALPTVTCPPTKVSFPLQCSFLLPGFMEGDSRGEKTGGEEAITINLRSSRTQTDSVWTGFCYWGWGAGPAGGRGAFREAGAFCLPRMGPIRAAGWRHCCGGSHPAQVPSQSKMGGALVSLTPEAPRLIAHGANTPQSAAASSITGY